jgi:2-haloacid dehalogenase/putative hydrolase of the HAD superfamily
MRAPRGVLWDVGNVIVGWSPRRLYETIFREPAACDRFLSSVCTLDWHIEHDRGVSFRDNAAPLIARHPELEAEIRLWGERFLDMVGPVFAETEAAIHALAARGVPQFGLTNMPSEAWSGVQALSPAFGHFRDTVVSGDEGLVKPDPAIFRLAAERAGMAPRGAAVHRRLGRQYRRRRSAGLSCPQVRGPRAAESAAGGPRTA